MDGVNTRKENILWDAPAKISDTTGFPSIFRIPCRDYSVMQRCVGWIGH